MTDDRNEPKFDWRAITPEDSPKTPMDVHGDPRHQALSTADVLTGGPAYDFASPIYDFSNGHQVITGRRFSLFEAAREKPVALIFGSYT
ncbi:MAG: hypothetical protein AAGE43_11695 [Pseudomonadota bacterium]